MKKLYTLTALISLSTAVLHAQNYVPLLDSTNVWHYAASPMVVRLEAPTPAASPCSYPGYFGSTKIQYTTHDTVIDSLTYKIVMEERDLNPNYCTFGYIREDTSLRKIFFLDNAGNPEILLYDFSLQLGDTFPVNFLSPGYIYQSGNFILDSVVPFSAEFGTTRLFCLNNHQFNSYTLYWAEGIGCLLNAFYPYSSNQNGSGWQFWQCRYYPVDSDEYLTCFDHAQKVYFDSCKYTAALADFCFQVTDSCNYWNICGSIEESTLNATIDVFPNPASECLNITLHSDEKCEIKFTIFDVNGNIVTDVLPGFHYTGGQRELSLDISSLTAGPYFLQCSCGDKAVSQSFIKQ